MSLLHVQKWMAHLSPEMTLVYAKVLDNTLRKSWEETTKQGLFRIDERGSVRKINISELENEDQVEWEYIRYHLDAVRMPLGYCMKPKKQECRSQLILKHQDEVVSLRRALYRNDSYADIYSDLCPSFEDFPAYIKYREILLRLS